MKKKINFSSIKTTGNRIVYEDSISKINEDLDFLPIKQRAILLATIIEESGGDPLAKSPGGLYQGLLQWGPGRYQIQSSDKDVELTNQLKYLKSTLYNLDDHVSWTNGGRGSGYNTLKEAYDAFTSTENTLEDAYRGFSYGYVRPMGKDASVKNRYKVALQVYARLLEAADPLGSKYNARLLPEVTVYGQKPRNIRARGRFTGIFGPQASHWPSAKNTFFDFDANFPASRDMANRQVEQRISSLSDYTNILYPSFNQHVDYKSVGAQQADAPAKHKQQGMSENDLRFFEWLQRYFARKR